MSLIDLVLLLSLVGVCTVFGKASPDLRQRYRYAFAASLLVLGAGLVLSTWWRN